VPREALSPPSALPLTLGAARAKIVSSDLPAAAAIFIVWRTIMEMPKPQDEHRKLKTLTGSWVGEETIYPSPWDPQGGPAKSKFQARADMDGFFVLADYVEERGGQVAYRGHGVYGYDPQTKAYTMHWFDSMGSGSPAPARGRWEGDRLSFEATSPMGQSRYSYRFESDDRYTFTIESSQDGGKTWNKMMDGRFTRKPA